MGRTGFGWLRIGSSGGLLWTRWWAFGFRKKAGFLMSWVTISFSNNILHHGVSKYFTRPPQRLWCAFFVRQLGECQEHSEYDVNENGRCEKLTKKRRCRQCVSHTQKHIPPCAYRLVGVSFRLILRGNSGCILHRLYSSRASNVTGGWDCWTAYIWCMKRCPGSWAYIIPLRSWKLG
jgi:hypothetical protein